MKNRPPHPLTLKSIRREVNLSRQQKCKALKWLAKTFPNAFNTEERLSPLKKGILKDIFLHLADAQSEGISKSKIKEAIAIFTHRIEYLACLKNKEARIDLNGNIVQDVTNDEANDANVLLKNRIELLSKKNQPLTKNEPKRERQPTHHAVKRESKPRQRFQSPPSDYGNYMAHREPMPINPPKTTAVIVKPKQKIASSSIAELKKKLLNRIMPADTK